MVRHEWSVQKRSNKKYEVLEFTKLPSQLKESCWYECDKNSLYETEISDQSIDT